MKGYLLSSVSRLQPFLKARVIDMPLFEHSSLECSKNSLPSYLDRLLFTVQAGPTADGRFFNTPSKRRTTS